MGDEHLLNAAGAAITTSAVPSTRRKPATRSTRKSSVPSIDSDVPQEAQAVQVSSEGSFGSKQAECRPTHCYLRMRLFLYILYYASTMLDAHVRTDSIG